MLLAAATGLNAHFAAATARLLHFAAARGVTKGVKRGTCPGFQILGGSKYGEKKKKKKKCSNKLAPNPFLWYMPKISPFDINTKISGRGDAKFGMPRAPLL